VDLPSVAEIVLDGALEELTSLGSGIRVSSGSGQVEWADTGNVLLVSCGLDGQELVVMKQQLRRGKWDVMKVGVKGA